MRRIWGFVLMGLMVGQAVPASALSPLDPAAPAPPAQRQPSPQQRSAQPEPRAMPPAGPVGATLACESDGSYRRCPADTRDGVTLQRELSSNACVARSTWGFDGSGIWVDKGCRAEFAVAAAGPAAPTGSTGEAGGSTGGGAAPEDGGGIGAGTVLGAAGIAVAAGAIAALLSGSDNDRGGKDKAVQACQQRADSIVRRNGGKSAKLTNIDRAKQGKGVVEIDARVKVRWQRGESNGRIECEVETNRGYRIVSFREQGLSSGGGNGGGGWNGGGGNSSGRERAESACRNAAERRGYRVSDILGAERRRDDWRIDLSLRRDGKRSRAACDYDANRRQAQLRLG